MRWTEGAIVIYQRNEAVQESDSLFPGQESAIPKREASPQDLTL